MRRGRLLPLFLLLMTTVSSAARDDGAASEFKIYVSFYSAGVEPISRLEMVSYKGKIYQFPDDSDEFTIYDPADKTCTLVDRRRKVFARVQRDRLEASMATLRRKLQESVDRKEKSKDRGERVEARMHRDLIDPKFVAAFDPTTRRLKLSNGSVQVEADGVSDLDPGRLALFAESSAALIKLGSLRDSDSIPPFTRLDALTELFARQLRPVDIQFVYRLTGPPIKYRWTYRIEQKLSENDQIAMSRIERSRAMMKLIAFAEYDRPE